MRKGWRSLPLSKVCKLFTDGNWIETKDQSSSGIRLIQTGNVGVGGFKDRRNKARFISEETFVRLKCQEVVAGDCLVSRLPDPVGRSCVIPPTGDKMITAVDCTIIRFDQSSIVPEYFTYYSQSGRYLSEIEAYCTGATRKRISRSNLGKVELPIPPLPEQKRIVAILDEAFAGIDTAVANTEKNLSNARKLFDSYLSSLLNRQRDGWAKTSLGNEIRLKTGFAFKSNGYTEEVDAVPLLRGDNIVQGRLRWENHKKWPKTKASDYSEYSLQQGDVVLAMDRTWVKAGLKYAQISAADLPCLLVQRVARLRAGTDLDAAFLKHLIGSNGFTDYVLSIQTGLGVPHISGNQISEFEFYRPDLIEQEGISSVMAEIDQGVCRLESIYKQKLASLVELKQVLLEKAFSGELTDDAPNEAQAALA